MPIYNMRIILTKLLREYIGRKFFEKDIWKGSLHILDWHASCIWDKMKNCKRWSKVQCLKKVMQKLLLTNDKFYHTVQILQDIINLIPKRFFKTWFSLFGVIDAKKLKFTERENWLVSTGFRVWNITLLGILIWQHKIIGISL